LTKSFYNPPYTALKLSLIIIIVGLSITFSGISIHQGITQNAYGKKYPFNCPILNTNLTNIRNAGLVKQGTLLTSRIYFIADQTLGNSSSTNALNQTDLLTCETAALANETAALANETAALANESASSPLDRYLGLGGTVAGIFGAVFAGFAIRREAKTTHVKNLTDMFDKIYSMHHSLGTKPKGSAEYIDQARKFVAYMELLATLGLNGDIRRDVLTSYNSSFGLARNLLNGDLKDDATKQGYGGNVKLWCEKEGIP
jgi:hypothetical protein